MLKHLFHVVVAACLIACLPPASADTPDAGKAQLTAEQFMASLKFQGGKIDLPGGIATLDLPPNFRYLDPGESDRVLVDAWGNPPGHKTLGMIYPADVNLLSQESWAVVITYEEDGHIKDDDANKINFDDLLKQMKEGEEAANQKRAQQGYPTMQLEGWAEAPHYDQGSHKLYWALNLATSDSKEHTLNYNIRVLGRKGVLVLNAVSAMHQLPAIKAEMQNVIAFTDFKAGNSYADFNSSTDKVAEYGIATLIAGGVAAKMGLFAKLAIWLAPLWKVLLASWKLVIAGLVALVAGIGKLLGLRKKESSPESRE